MFKRISMLAAAAVLSMASAASATVVLQDDFDYGTTDVLNIVPNFSRAELDRWSDARLHLHHRLHQRSRRPLP